jgi:uncharacterized protein
MKMNKKVGGMYPIAEKFNPESVPFTVTGSGRKFYPTQPSRTDFNIHDIARGLSKANRWSGQTMFPYSVAEHSVHCSNLFPNDPVKAYRALLHDASEAYLSDVARPIKALLPHYQEIERNTEDAVYFQFGVETDDYDVIDAVHAADIWMVFEERRQLFEFPQLVEGTYKDWTLKPILFFEQRPVSIGPWSWSYAERQFLETYKRLRPTADMSL